MAHPVSVPDRHGLPESREKGVNDDSAVEGNVRRLYYHNRVGPLVGLSVQVNGDPGKSELD